MTQTQIAPSTDILDHWIAGKPSPGGRRLLPVHDPASGDEVARIPLADAAEVDRAVGAAASALHGWAQTSLTKRAAVMFRFRALLDEARDELARLISREHGKTLADAQGEVARGLDVVDYACSLPQLLQGTHSDQVSGGIDAHALRQPLGVCVGITPFNFPIMVPMWMHPVAIAAGNTFVLKPSERDPSVSNRIAALYQQAGLPDGVFNVLHGDHVAVDSLLEHPGVAAVSFVGSTPVARHVFERASANGKRVQALGGAKNHAVVMPDADPDFAAGQLVSAAFGSAGQRCMAVSVAVAVGPIADELVRLLDDKGRQIKVGRGLDSSSDMGPVISPEARERIAGYISSGQNAGARLVLDGRAHAVPSAGAFLGPTIFDEVAPQMDIYRDEIFGPVLCVVRVPTLDDALELINANPFANGAAIFTNDGASARRFEREAQVGMIGVNIPIPVPMAFYSFGGWRDSLFGDHHIHGPEGVRFYTRAKAITTRWPGQPDTSAIADKVGLHFPAAR